MNNDELISGEGFDPENLPEFNGELVKLHEYGTGSCFGCGEVVQSPRKVNGKLQDGFKPGTAPPQLSDEDVKF